jgi:hypothetical protein
MVAVRLIGRKAMNKIIAPQSEVQAEVRKQAHRLGRIAEARLAAHRKTGDHKIVIEKRTSMKYGFLDYLISLEGSAPLSVEFGHRNHRGGYVQGLYIMTSLL